MSDKPKKQVKPAAPVEASAPTPPARPSAKAAAASEGACPVCGTGMAGNRCEVDGYQRADV